MTWRKLKENKCPKCLTGNIGTVIASPGYLLCSRRLTPKHCTFAIAIAKAEAIIENMNIHSPGYRRPLSDVEAELAAVQNPKYEAQGGETVPFNERTTQETREREDDTIF